MKLKNIIDCTGFSSEEINYKVKELVFDNSKHIILKNPTRKKGLLEGLKGEVKIEIIGDVGSEFANNINGPKIIVNGNIGNNSAQNIKGGKLTVFGSCGSYFACNAESSEFYILENCSKNSFFNIKNNSKVIVGGQITPPFGKNSDSTFVILNLSGGAHFIDDEWNESIGNNKIFLRGNKEKIRTTSKKIKLIEANNNDEDVYLPLISEYARLFNYSLDEIKSIPFYKIEIVK